MPLAPVPFHRRSIRLKGYDYSSPGAYFVTVVTNGHKCIFGKIKDNEMQLGDLGIIAQECWMQLPDHFIDIEVIPFVVMPNHLHGIITIHENDRRGTIYRAPTTEKFGQPAVGSIPTIMRTYKAAVSRLAVRKLGIVKIWQRNYYEHIIRDQTGLESIINYILTNPIHWSDDLNHIHYS
jgi:putative transposase